MNPRLTIKKITSSLLFCGALIGMIAMTFAGAQAVIKNLADPFR